MNIKHAPIEKPRFETGLNHCCCERRGLTSQKAFRQGAVTPQAAGPDVHGAVGTAYVPPRGYRGPPPGCLERNGQIGQSRMLNMEPMKTGSSFLGMRWWEHAPVFLWQKQWLGAREAKLIGQGTQSLLLG